MKNKILIILFIFLGVLWLYKNNKIIEGASKAELQSLNDNSRAQMAGLGLDLQSNDEILGLLDRLSDVATNEIKAAEKRAEAQAQADSITAAVDTTQPTIPTVSFFSGFNFGGSFCDLYGGNPTNLKNQCAALNAESCNSTNCCVWANGKKCLPGNATGPSVPAGTLSTIDSDYYSYKFKCYGKCEAPKVVPRSTTTANPVITAGVGANAAPTSTGDCKTDNNSTVITPECVNLAWSELGCDNTWKQISTNKGWFNLPNSLLNVDTTGKSLYYKEYSNQVADITGQKMGDIRSNMENLAKNNPVACVASIGAVSSTDSALSMLMGM